MKKTLFLLCTLLLCVVSSSYARGIIPLERWNFMLGECTNGQAVELDDSAWERVRVPHDWAIGKPFDMTIDMQHVQVKEDGEKAPKLRTGRTGALPCFGIGWYRTSVTSTPYMKDKSISIEIDGAMMHPQVYLNGNFVGEWINGYSSFSLELSKYWNFDGENIIAVRMENKPESSRWYSGAGLYRNVRLVMKDKICVAHWGTVITTSNISKSKASVDVSTEVENNGCSVSSVMVINRIIDKSNNIVAEVKKNMRLKPGKTVVNSKLIINKPMLWDIETPNLYSLRTTVTAGNKECDSVDNSFGVRTTEFDASRGFFLNGKYTKIQGVCLHHDLGPLGAAVNVCALRRQLEMMKEMGCNAIRTSHNSPAPELVTLCDEIGLMLQIEAFDEWKIAKNDNGYHRYFDEWHERDLHAMIRRDINHPSVIMWSIGNEVREQADKNGAQVAKMLTDICHKEDPTRPVTCGFSMHLAAIENGLTDCVDLVGFNYKAWDYAHQHKLHPNYKLYGSETSSTVSSRGEYIFPIVEKKNVYYEDRYHVSSYDVEYPNWAYTPDLEFEKQDSCSFAFGEFIWTGFDYLGEPTPFNQGTPARSSYFGAVDLCGLKKDRFYLYQSRWNKKVKVLHLLPHWNFENDREGKITPVMCYTNYPKVELFVNGVSQGIKTKSGDNKFTKYRLIWDNVVYEPGELKAVACDDKGNVADTHVVKTAGTDYKISLTADKQKLKADGKDVLFVTVEIMDKDGNPSPRSSHMLFFKADGNARVKAACNGDPTDQTPFHTTYMRVFNGKLVLVLEGENVGKASLNVYGGRLKPATLKFDVVE